MFVLILLIHPARGEGVPVRLPRRRVRRLPTLRLRRVQPVDHQDDGAVEAELRQAPGPGTLQESESISISTCQVRVFKPPN